MTHSSGVTVTAVTQLRTSETNTTWYSERQNSPVLSSEVPMAAKARMAMTVAPSSGMADCFTTAIAAWVGSSPFAEPDQHAVDDDDGVVDQHAQGDDQRAQRDALQGHAHGAQEDEAPAIVSSSTKPISSPLRSPMKNSRTTITIATAWREADDEAADRRRHRLGLSEMIPNSMPSGISDSSSSDALLAAPRPSSTTLPPRTVEMPEADGGAAVVAHQVVPGGST